MRISKDEYYLNIADEVSGRSTCLRRQYGAVIVKNDEIISTGYNGSPRGEDNCCDVGECWREAHNIPHGSQYEKCVAVHAEQNAIISASRQEMIGSTLYLVGNEKGRSLVEVTPCEICMRMIKNAGIQKIVTKWETIDFSDVNKLKDKIETLRRTLKEYDSRRAILKSLESSRDEKEYPFIEYEP